MACEVRSSPGGAQTGTEAAGQKGTVTGASQVAAYQGYLYIWWPVQWSDGQTGWCAEASQTGSKMVHTNDPMPPTVHLTAPNSGTFYVGNQVTLSATASDDYGVIYQCGYFLYKAGAEIGPIDWDSAGQGMISQYNWTIPATLNGYTLNGTDYQVVFGAWDPSNNGSLDASDNYLTIQPVPSPPPTPTGLSASAQDVQDILVSWNTSTGATSYTLDRSGSSNGPGWVFIRAHRCSTRTAAYSLARLTTTKSPRATPAGARRFHRRQLRRRHRMASRRD